MRNVGLVGVAPAPELAEGLAGVRQLPGTGTAWRDGMAGAVLGRTLLMMFEWKVKDCGER